MEKRSKTFRGRIRKYNGALQMASSGAHVKFEPRPSSFKISGNVHHCMVSMFPAPDRPPTALSLFCIDRDDEIENRLALNVLRLWTIAFCANSATCSIVRTDT